MSDTVNTISIGKHTYDITRMAPIHLQQVLLDLTVNLTNGPDDPVQNYHKKKIVAEKYAREFEIISAKKWLTVKSQNQKYTIEDCKKALFLDEEYCKALENKESSELEADVSEKLIYQNARNVESVRSILSAMVKELNVS